ncbi:hypothetical protein BD626DRAFT_561113 [Schizophyllum amplum]|uniref:Uncharacterized protein n=1 Tax=Schizophyllum amplum TaxID=97359 RepID=A0A550BTA0_9AGAR|nr:hypothetical protein BD626DRAFT_561113 [Auriculariopsis ampla]
MHYHLELPTSACKASFITLLFVMLVPYCRFLYAHIQISPQMRCRSCRTLSSTTGSPSITDDTGHHREPRKSIIQSLLQALMDISSMASSLTYTLFRNHTSDSGPPCGSRASSGLSRPLSTSPIQPGQAARCWGSLSGKSINTKAPGRVHVSLTWPQSRVWFREMSRSSRGIAAG